MLEAVLRPVLSTPEQAAAGIVHLATSPEMAGHTGGYYGPFPRKPSRTTRDPALASCLWQLSEELTDFQYFRKVPDG